MRQTFNWGNNWNFSKYIERHKYKETRNSASPRKVNTRKKDLSEWWSNYWKAKEQKILKRSWWGGESKIFIHGDNVKNDEWHIITKSGEQKTGRQWTIIFKELKEKKIQSIQNSTSSEKTEQLRDFITNRHELKEMSKEVLH